MSLPSQTARTLALGHSATTFRRKRRRVNPRAVTALTIVAGLAVALIWGGSALLSGPSDAKADQPGARDSASSDAGERRPATPGWTVSPPEPRSDTARASERKVDSPTIDPPERPTEDSEPKPPSSPAMGGVERSLAAGEARFREGNLVEARVHFNRALLDASATGAQRDAARTALARISEELIFSPQVAPGDPYAEWYTVQANDSLVKIASRQGLAIDHRFIARINRMSDPNRIRLGMKLKLVRGPFHAVVSKSAFRLDLYAADPSDPEDAARRVYIRSFAVGLGEKDGTPLGEFIVKPDSKLIDPHWVNPRSGEAFEASDPRNPIGEHWIGLVGVGDSQGLAGYGIHGTIDPGSIGQMKSMGCVRLKPDDVAMLYELLEERVSRVSIVP